MAVAVPAASAATTYPTAKGSTFTNSNDGWQESGKSCATLLSLLPNLLCEVSTGIDATNGKPPGSLTHDFRNVVGAVSPVVGPVGRAVSISPSFTVAGYPTATSATLTYERRVTNNSLTGKLLPMIPQGVNTTVTLVDETMVPNKETVISAAPKDTLDTDFVSITTPVPVTTNALPTLTAGHKYHLQLATDYKPLLDAAIGTLSAKYDNIKLTVDDGTVAPSATTTPATNITGSSATLNGSVNTGATTTDATHPGPATRYHFEYGPTTAYGQKSPEKVTTANGPVPGEVIGGLAPLTTYYYRLVVTTPDDVDVPSPTGASFTTLTTTGATGATGTTGATGATGAGGAPGAAGPAGTNGAAGPQGAAGVGTAGAPGAAGKPGPAGPQGAAGPKGSAGVTGSSTGQTTIVQNGSNKSLLKIKPSDVTLVTTGRLKGQVRLPIFCSSKTGRACAGTVKIRTRYEINPATRPPARAKRRVTIATFEYQIAQGRQGFAFAYLSPDKFDLMQRVKSIAVIYTVQVTDSQGNRQVVSATGRLIGRKKALSGTKR